MKYEEADVEREIATLDREFESFSNNDKEALAEQIRLKIMELEHGHTHSANQCPAFRCSICHKLS